MALARTHSVALVGVEGHLIDVIKRHNLPVVVRFFDDGLRVWKVATSECVPHSLTCFPAGALPRS
jgi:hypothetical protein